MDYLTGARSVVIDHCFNHFGPWLRFNSETDPILQQIVANTPLNLIYSGIPAVYIFFLMSGFVLTLGYFGNNKDYLETAFIKRIPRLVLPCVGAALFFYVCHLLAMLAGGAIPSARLGDLLIEALWKAPALGEVRRNGPLWTISWEIYGSLLVFALLACFGNRRYFKWICLAAVVWFLPTNYLPFMVGMTICWAIYTTNIIKRLEQAANWKSFVYFACLILSLWLMSYPYKRDGIVIPNHMLFMSWTGDWVQDYRNSVMLGAVIFFVIFMVWDPIKRFFNKTTLVFLGKISFSAYLIHIPLIWLTDIALGRFFSHDVFGFLAKMVIVLVLTLVSAIFFERFVDRPAIKLSSEVAKKIMRR